MSKNKNICFNTLSSASSTPILNRKKSESARHYFATLNEPHLKVTEI